MGMKTRSISWGLSQSFVTHSKRIAALLAALGCMTATASDRLSALIDSAQFSREDKEAITAGLRVALPSSTTDYVSPQTIDLQIKKSANFRDAANLVFGVSEYLDNQIAEFTSSETFRSIEAGNRANVAAFLNKVVEQYRGRACETLLKHYGKTIAVPAEVPRSIENVEYRNLLALAVKVCATQEPVIETPAVVAKATQAPAPVEIAAPAEKPAVEEKPAVVETPGPIKAVAVVETVVEKPVATEKPVTVETPASAVKPVAKTEPQAIEKPAAPKAPAGKRYVLQVGDSLALLARLNKVTATEILQANPGVERRTMRVGQTIVIPAPKSAEAAKAGIPATAPTLSSTR
jgi:LysM repeat protein